jgi:hypothetical protein
LGTLPDRVNTTRITLCPRSAVGSNMHGQPPIDHGDAVLAPILGGRRGDTPSAGAAVHPHVPDAAIDTLVHGVLCRFEDWYRSPPRRCRREPTSGPGSTDRPLPAPSPPSRRRDVSLSAPHLHAPLPSGLQPGPNGTLSVASARPEVVGGRRRWRMATTIAPGLPGHSVLPRGGSFRALNRFHARRSRSSARMRRGVRGVSLMRGVVAILAWPLPGG